jgi:PPM family protein phosphatase
MEKIKFDGISFIGRRKNNEDAILKLKIDENTYCFAVADGMGGAEGGEIASSEALKVIELNVKELFLINQEDSPDLKGCLEYAFGKAQEKIAKLINKTPSLSGMGTTLTVLLVHNERYAWGNIGDSRIYRTDGDIIELITLDHTYIEQYRREHKTEVSENIARQYGNIITRSIGGNEDKPDLYPTDKDFEKLKPGTLFLLCSDGLITSKIADSGKAFLPFILHYKDLKTTAEQLIAKAFSDGSSDNISIVLAQVGTIKHQKAKKLTKFAYPPKIVPENKGSHEILKKSFPGALRRNLNDPLKILASLLFVALIISGYLYYRQLSKPMSENVLTETSKPESNNTQNKPEDSKEYEPENENAQGNINIADDIPGFEATTDDLVKLRKNALEGMIKLMVTFIEDERVKAMQMKNPLDHLFYAIRRVKPAFIVDLFYFSSDSVLIETDSIFKQIMLQDTFNVTNKPAINWDLRLIYNKSNVGEYIFIQFGQLDQVDPKSHDFVSNYEVFARESGLNGLTILLSHVVFTFFHPDNLIKDMHPWPSYLVYYENDISQKTSFGSVPDSLFDARASRVQKDFFIQSLNYEDTRFIDICTPVPRKENTVLRAGYPVK